MEASTSNHSHQQCVGSRAMEKEEIVKHMSSLPSYLERGQPIQDKALTFGVIDWGRLEKWQYQHHKIQGAMRGNIYSQSSSNSSPFFSTDGSSPQSSGGQSCSPAHHKPHRVTLQSHLNIPPKEFLTPLAKSRNLEKFQDFKNAPLKKHSEKKSQTPVQPETKRRDNKTSYPNPPNVPEFESSLKGKMKIKDEYRTNDHDHLASRKPVVLLLPNDVHEKSQTNSKKSMNTDRNSAQKLHYDLNNNIPNSCPPQSEVVSNKIAQLESHPARNPSVSSKSKTHEEKKSTVSSHNSDVKMDSFAVCKQRGTSPLRRFSFSVNSKSSASTSAIKRAESPPVSRNSIKNNSCVLNRAHSSPLRRLLDPLFPSKATNSHEDSNIKAKPKLNLRNCKEVTIDEDSRRNEKNESSSTSTKQALFQTVIKNGRPLFTFAVENSSDILAATVRSLNSSEKDNKNSWIYTFFTVQEVKKKNGNWLSQGGKGKGHGYVPNVAAQMKVSTPSVSDFSTREFFLYSVDPTQFDLSEVNPHDELAAIVVKFSREVDDEGNQENFSTTVILPGGNHGVPSKGEPSPLIERWLSGGVCDCGGWDIGCRLRTLTNQAQSSRSKSTKVHLTSDKFELFFQGEVINEKPFFSLSPMNEGIFSVEYNSSLSLLQAFSICISTAECRKTSENMQQKTYIAKQVNDDVPVRYASFPPLSPVQRA